MTLTAIVAFLTAAAARAMPRREDGDVEITRLREENARLRSERDALAVALERSWREQSGINEQLAAQYRPVRDVEAFDCTADRSHFLLGLQGQAHAQQQHQAMLAQMQQLAAFNNPGAAYVDGFQARNIDRAVNEFWGLNDNRGGE